MPSLNVTIPDETIAVTIVDGSIVAEVVSTGPPGETGPQGDPGPGVPDGGTTAQSLVKTSVDDHDTEWADRIATVSLGGSTDIPFGAVDATDPANPVIWPAWLYTTDYTILPEGLPGVGSFWLVNATYGIPGQMALVTDGVPVAYVDHGTLGLPSPLTATPGHVLVAGTTGAGTVGDPLQVAGWQSPADALGGAAVLKSGDTMTGDLTLDEGARLIIHRDEPGDNEPLLQLRNQATSPVGNVLEVLGHIATGSVRYGCVWNEGAQMKMNTSLLVSGTFVAQNPSEPPGGPSYMLAIVSDLASADASLALYPPAGSSAGTVRHIVAYDAHATTPTAVFEVSDRGAVTTTGGVTANNADVIITADSVSAQRLRLKSTAAGGSVGLLFVEDAQQHWLWVKYGGDGNLYMRDQVNGRQLWQVWPGSAGNSGTQIADHLEVKRGSAGQSNPLLDCQDHGSNSLVSVSANGNLTLADGINLVTGTASGSKLGSTSAEKLALWGATPIVQPTTSGAEATFSAGSGAAVNDDSTFDGYTLPRVVKALREAGILA